MEKNITKTLRSLKSRNLNGLYARDREEAVDKILDLISEGDVVGIGDSTTLKQIGIIEALRRKGIQVYDGFERGISRELHDKMVRESTLCDVFLTGTNAITLDGKLVNVDAAGNRVAGMFHGHQKSIVVVGRNKLVSDLEKAFHRIRRVIAPNHVRIRTVELSMYRIETPCVATGACSDCRSKDRMCNVFTIIEGRPMRTDISIVIVDEDLGLAWDESWPKERVYRIKEEYKKFSLR
jgi:hypothetical protein